MVSNTVLRGLRRFRQVFLNYDLSFIELVASAIKSGSDITRVLRFILMVTLRVSGNLKPFLEAVEVHALTHLFVIDFSNVTESCLKQHVSNGTVKSIVFDIHVIHRFSITPTVLGCATFMTVT